MTQRQLLIKNIRSLVSCDDNGTVHSNVDLLCGDGKVLQIGEMKEPLIDLDIEVIDGSNFIIYPGLINTHHHFFQAFVRNQISLDWSKLSLVQWLDRIYKIFTLINEDCIYHSSLVSLAELAKYGCTTAFDHQYCFNRHAGSHLVDRQFEAAEKLGMRFVAGRGTNTLRSSEGSTMPDEMVETTAEYLKDCERLISHYHDSAIYAMRSVVLAPCQPVNCKEETFIESLALARSHGIHLHTHLSEGENALMEARWGQRSLDWCIERGFYGSDVWLAHGWEMTTAEFQKMAETDTGLSHCTPAMCLVGDGITDLAAAYAAGVPIGLGVDGQASNDNSNLLECIRLSYLLQCLGAKDRANPIPPPEAFLNFATRGGAQLLGRSELGQLIVGSAADFFAIDCRNIELTGTLHDPALIPVKVGIGQPTAITVVAGQVIWRDGAFTHIDEHKISADANQVCEDVILGSSVMRHIRQGGLSV